MGGTTSRSVTPRHDGLIHGLMILFVALLMLVSSMALNAIGWNYDGTGGSGPTRFHPATYLMVILFIIVALRDGNPLASLISGLGQDLLLAVFLVIWAIVFYHGIANQGLPAAGLIDTFLLPILTLMVFRRLETRTKITLTWLVHAIFAANALLGLLEFASGFRLTPFVTGGAAISDDWRSTAFLGHPLGNALLTGGYAIILMLGGARELEGWSRFSMLFLQCAAMIAFGGRSSLVLLMLAGAIASTLAIYRLLAGQRLALPTIAIFAGLLPFIVAGLGLALELGAFDKLIERFVEDKGSAQARVIMFQLFDGFTLQELLFGPQLAHLSHLINIYRLEFGIESMWVAFSLYYGILPAILFFAGLGLFMISLTSHCMGRSWVVVGYYFVVNSGFLGIAGKTTGFTVFCLVLLLLLPAVHPLPAPAHRGMPRPLRLKDA